MTISITAAELTAGLQAAEALIADAKKALAGRLADLPADAVFVEDVAADLDKLGVPYAGDAELAVKAFTWVCANIQTVNGGVVGALLDSLNGVQRTVANADGSDLTNS